MVYTILLSGVYPDPFCATLADVTEHRALDRDWRSISKPIECFCLKVAFFKYTLTSAGSGSALLVLVPYLLLQFHVAGGRFNKPFIHFG